MVNFENLSIYGIPLGNMGYKDECSTLYGIIHRTVYSFNDFNFWIMYLDVK